MSDGLVAFAKALDGFQFSSFTLEFSPSNSAFEGKPAVLMTANDGQLSVVTFEKGQPSLEEIIAAVKSHLRLLRKREIRELDAKAPARNSPDTQAGDDHQRGLRAEGS